MNEADRQARQPFETSLSRRPLGALGGALALGGCHGSSAGGMAAGRAGPGRGCPRAAPATHEVWGRTTHCVSQLPARHPGAPRAPSARVKLTASGSRGDRALPGAVTSVTSRQRLR